jgi:5-hydroxyisourate hydrolase
MTRLSTHVLDIERGQPAVGVPVSLFRERRLVASARTNTDGRIADLANVESGGYRIEFDAAAYFALDDRAAPFLKRVSIDFEVQPGATHYHVPLLLSPYACTSYRGS